MKLKKSEIIVISVTVAAVFFTAGFFTGRGTNKTTLNFYTAETEIRGDIVPVPSQTPTDSSGSVVININIASADELSYLEGIGPVLAERIVEYREQYGPFESIDQIMNVEGVGEGKYKAIKDYICVS